MTSTKPKGPTEAELLAKGWRWCSELYRWLPPHLAHRAEPRRQYDLELDYRELCNPTESTDDRR